MIPKFHHISLGIAASSLLVPAAAAAEALTCATLSRASGSYASNTGVNFSVEPGDRITVSAASNATGQVAVPGVNIFYVGDLVTTAGDTASTAADGIITIGPLTPTGPAELRISCSSGGGSSDGDTGTDDGDTGTGGDTGDIGSGPTRPATGAPDAAPAPGQPTTEARPATATLSETLLTYGSQIGAGTQSGAVNAAVSSAVAAYFGNATGFLATKDLMFLSTRSLGDDTAPVDLWFRLSGQRFDGDVEGQGSNLTVGGHYRISPTAVAGLLADIGRFEIDSAGADLEVDALAVGPYFAARLGAVDVDGYALFARPTYDFGAGETDAQRRLYGLTVSARFDAGSVSVAPFARVSGYREEIEAGGPVAARDVAQDTLSAGARVDFQTGTAFRPWLSVAADAWRFDDGTTETEATTPALATGFTFDTGTGRVTADIASSEVAEDVQSLAVSLRYDFAF